MSRREGETVRPGTVDHGTVGGVDPGARPAQVVATVAAALVCAALPVFLVGALSERIGDELGLSGGGIGAALAGFFLAGAVASVPAGRFADRVGSGWALRTGLAAATVTGIGIGLTARSGVVLAAFLCVGGISVALVDTGGARALAGAVPVARQGLAFGGKEASIPVAALLAGLTLPALGERLGWRTAFLAAAAVAVVVGVLVPSSVERLRTTAGGTRVAAGHRKAAAPARPEPEARPAPSSGSAPAPAGMLRPPLIALAIAAGLGAAAANAAATFLVRGAVDAGVAPGAAGVLLASASAASVAARLGIGVVADRRTGGELRIVVALMTVGTLGLAGLATQTSPLLAPSAVLALGAGWGWTGLVFLAAVRLDPARPARAAGIVLAGLAVGGAGGPAAFGALSTEAGFPTAWTAASVAMGLAALVAVVAAHRASQHHRGGTDRGGTFREHAHRDLGEPEARRDHEGRSPLGRSPDTPSPEQVHARTRRHRRRDHRGQLRDRGCDRIVSSVAGLRGGADEAVCELRHYQRWYRRIRRSSPARMPLS